MGGGASKSKKEGENKAVTESGAGAAASHMALGRQKGAQLAAGVGKNPGLKKAAPKWKPPHMEDDIVQHASMLGLSVTNREDEEFLWIAERAARDLMKPPWVRLLDETTGKTYYFHGVTKESAWTTPYLSQYKKLLRQRRQQKKQAELIEVAEAAAKEETGNGVLMHASKSYCETMTILA